MSDFKEFISYLYKTKRKKYFWLLILLIGAIAYVAILFNSIPNN